MEDVLAATEELAEDCGGRTMLFGALAKTLVNAQPFEFQNGEIRSEISLSSYRLDAIKKAAYRCADRCTVVLDGADGDRLPVRFVFKSGTPELTANESVRLFFQELLDQELREQVRDETAALRTLILAHAFSKTALIKQE